MRIRKGAIALIIIAITGVVIFTTTPLITARERVQGSDASGSWDIVITLKVSFRGIGKLIEKGVQYGSDYYYEEYWSPSTWIFYGKSFPIRITIFTLISLAMSVYAGFVSLFGYDSKRRIIGSVLGLVAGCFIITGELLFIEWGRWFSGLTSFTYTNRYFNLGFIVPLIIGCLIIAISLVLLLVKPKIKEVAISEGINNEYEENLKNN